MSTELQYDLHGRIIEVETTLADTPEWAELNEKYDMDLASNQTLLRLLFEQKLTKGNSVEQRQNLLRAVLRAGGVVSLAASGNIPAGRYEFELKTEQVEEEESVEEQPVHRGQEQWRQHAEFMRSGGKNGGEPTMDEVRARKAVNPSFRAFVENSLRLEIQNEVGDPANDLNARPQEPLTPNKALIEWVEQYRRTPSDQVRKLSRFDFNPNGAAEYQRCMQAAIESGLI